MCAGSFLPFEYLEKGFDVMDEKFVRKITGILLICFIFALGASFISIKSVKADFSPDWECPVCVPLYYDYVCNDYHCSQPNPHGVYEMLRCLECDSNYYYYYSFLYCHNMC